MLAGPLVAHSGVEAVAEQVEADHDQAEDGGRAGETVGEVLGVGRVRGDHRSAGKVRLGGDILQLAFQLLDLIPQFGGVLELELLGRFEHLGLEVGDQVL